MQSYPIEVTFLDALEELDSLTEVLEAELIEASEMPRKVNEYVDHSNPFPNYFFAFKDEGSLHILAYDEKRELLWSKRLPLEKK